MNKHVEDIAAAVLYEGYMLYPYRPSAVKNRQRWNFGVVYPKAYSEAQCGNDSCFMQTECLVAGSSATELSVKVRFLQAVARTIGRPPEPLREWLPDRDKDALAPQLQPVGTMQVEDRLLQSWEEAVEKEIVIPPLPFKAESVNHSALVFFPSGQDFEPVRDGHGQVAAFIVRTRKPIASQVEVSVNPVKEGLFRVAVRISNVTATDPAAQERSEALMQSLLSAHTILEVCGGEFVSLLDPPDELKEFVSGCANRGTYPVLAGEEGKKGTMLSSPVILYDYPQIAPESAGNLFDSTEIDEILALRILTLTDDEKHEMRDADPRSREILERTETLPAEHFMKLHGALRGLRPSHEEKP